jgi:hypothetical protein
MKQPVFRFAVTLGAAGLVAIVVVMPALSARQQSVTASQFISGGPPSEWVPLTYEWEDRVSGVLYDAYVEYHSQHRVESSTVDLGYFGPHLIPKWAIQKSPTLQHILAKLHRAEEHIDLLETEVNAYLEQHTNPVLLNYDSESEAAFKRAMWVMKIDPKSHAAREGGESSAGLG